MKTQFEIIIEYFDWSILITPSTRGKGGGRI